jgi:ABC-type Fe3+-siderophore transport system permease subunit
VTITKTFTFPKTRRSSLTVILTLTLSLIVTCVVSIGIGAVRIAPLEVLQFLTDSSGGVNARIVQELRLPRIIVAVVCGALFAVSGAILQGVVRNPLASPDLVGVGAGAGVAAVVTLILLPSAPAWLLPVGAFVGAWLGFAMVIWLSVRHGEVTPLRVALIGVAVGAALGAVQQLVLIRAPDGIAQALSFLSGTVYGADWSRVSSLLPWLSLLPVAWLLAGKLDVLAFSDEVSKSLGMRLMLARVICMSVAVALAAAAVTGAGVLGFVGLIGPHAARLLIGSRHSLLLPTSALLGAILVVVADALGRGLLPPLEIPAGIVTTLIGAPYFLLLVRREVRGTR